MNPLHYRILELSKRHKLSHLGSCLGVTAILDDIYSRRQLGDPVILSCGHAALALYVVLEKWAGVDAEALLLKHGAHPSKDSANGIWCSTGSLGQGLTIAVGRALARRERNVWVVISDGEMAEGAVYEALNFAREQGLRNLKVFGFFNGFGAYREIDADRLAGLFLILGPINVLEVCTRSVDDLGFPFLKGQNAHYKQLNDEDWAWIEAHRHVDLNAPTGGGM